MRDLTQQELSAVNGGYYEGYWVCDAWGCDYVEYYVYDEVDFIVDMVILGVAATVLLAGAGAAIIL